MKKIIKDKSEEAKEKKLKGRKPKKEMQAFKVLPMKGVMRD